LTRRGGRAGRGRGEGGTGTDRLIEPWIMMNLVDVVQPVSPDLEYSSTRWDSPVKGCVT
jgi:hypothetical protein